RQANGDIGEVSLPFRSSRIIGSRIAVNFNPGQNTSCGLEFSLHEEIGDVFVDGMYAHHFMYRLNILNNALDVVSYGSWHSSLSMADMRRVILNAVSTPALTPTPPNQYTQFESYVVSRSGIEEATRHSVHFRAQDGFIPQALIYSQTAAALGEKHFSIVDDDLMYQNELIPRSGTNRNRRLWQGDNGLEAIWSPDLKLHLQWGYFGQYGNTTASGIAVITNNPWDPELNICADVQTHNDYYSRVEYFDLRWDNAPFPSQSYFVNPRVVTHQDGSTWLRIKNYNQQSRHHTFSGLLSGTHQLKVCAVDLQNVISDPAILQIDLLPYKPYDQRSGLLIVDDSANNASSPDAIVDNFYNAVIPANFGPVQSIDISSLDPDDSPLSPIMMQNYLGIIWHTDSPNVNPKLSSYADALNIYLGNSGHLVLSGTHKLAGVFDAWDASPVFLQSNFGITGEDNYGTLSASLVQNTYFIKAEGTSYLPDLDLEIENAINPIIEIKEGLSSVTYFNPGMQTENLYQFGCKPVTAGQDPPTQDEYDFYSSKYVGYLHCRADAEIAVFGFPLSYMEQQDVASAMQSLLLQMIGIIDKGGRGL
ncbi:MAG: hypothetical protein KA984_00670, partial [Candidatus Cloacimonetes bacterium]|nr:hypothetical protein [Candidatus Cloacimonadota bacterium]